MSLPDGYIIGTGQYARIWVMGCRVMDGAVWAYPKDGKWVVGNAIVRNVFGFAFDTQAEAESKAETLNKAQFDQWTKGGSYNGVIGR